MSRAAWTPDLPLDKRGRTDVCSSLPERLSAQMVGSGADAAAAEVSIGEEGLDKSSASCASDVRPECGGIELCLSPEYPSLVAGLATTEAVDPARVAAYWFSVPASSAWLLP